MVIRSRFPRLVAVLFLACAGHAAAQDCAPLPEPAARAACFRDQAKASYQARRYEEALARIESAKALAPDPDPELLLLAARANFGLQRYGPMEAEGRQAWRLARERSGPDHAQSLDAQNVVAVALRNTGRTAEALDLLGDLVDRRRKMDGPRAAETLRALASQANALTDAGDYERAARVYGEVFEARRAELGEHHAQTVAAWHNRAHAEWRARADPATLDAVERALPAQEKALGNRHAEIVRVKNLLGVMLADVGRHEEAARLFEDVLAARRASGGPANRSTREAARNLAVSTLQLGDPAGALAILDESAEPLPAAGTANVDAGTRHAAQVRAFALLQLDRATDALLALERLPPADTATQEASVGALNEGVLKAMALFGTGRGREAADRLRALKDQDAIRLGLAHPRVIDTTRVLAVVLAESGDRDSARALFEEVVARTEARARLAAGSTDTRRHLRARGITSLFLAGGYRRYARLLAEDDPKRGLAIAELSRARSFDEVAAIPRSPQAAEAARRLAKAEEAHAASEPGSRAWIEAAAERGRAEEALAKLRGPATAPATGRTEDLPVGSAYVAYVAEADHAVAFVATRDGNVTGHDLGSVAGLADTVEAMRRLAASSQPADERIWRVPGGYRWSLTRPSDATDRAKDLQEVSRFLSQRLVAPLFPRLKAAPRWVVSPDGPLAFLPFELLEANGGRVVDRHEVTLAPSLAAITAGRARAARVHTPGSRLEFLGIAVGEAGGDWAPLPAAAKEVERIARLFPEGGQRTLVGAQATEAAIAKLELGRYRYVHIAAHAFLSPKGNALSGVVLAPDPADKANDGILTAAEWSARRLRSDLVVLSACDTGRGSSLAGEGVMGLPHALLSAGTRDVLLTLWPVDDAAAADFMPRFYGRLRKGASPSRALRETKLELARSRGPHAAPRHWAAFVLTGVP